MIRHPEASTVPLMPDRHRSQGMPEPKIRGDTWGRHPLPSDRLSAHDPPGRPGRPRRPAPRGLAPRWHLNGQPGSRDPDRCRGVEREQPGEERQGQRRRDQQEGRLALLEDQIGQVAPHDLCECRQNEQERGAKQGSGLLLVGWSHLTPPQDTTALAPREGSANNRLPQRASMHRCLRCSHHLVPDQTDTLRRNPTREMPTGLTSAHQRTCQKKSASPR